MVCAPMDSEALVRLLSGSSDQLDIALAALPATAAAKLRAAVVRQSRSLFPKDGPKVLSEGIAVEVSEWADAKLASVTRPRTRSRLAAVDPCPLVNLPAELLLRVLHELPRSVMERSQLHLPKRPIPSCKLAERQEALWRTLEESGLLAEDDPNRCSEASDLLGDWSPPAPHRRGLQCE